MYEHCLLVGLMYVLTLPLSRLKCMFLILLLGRLRCMYLDIASW